MHSFRVVAGCTSLLPLQVQPWPSSSSLSNPGRFRAFDGDHARAGAWGAALKRRGLIVVAHLGAPCDPNRPRQFGRGHTFRARRRIFLGLHSIQ